MAEPKKTAEGVTFDIHIQGDESGKTYAGTFRAKEKRTFADRIQADRRMRELLGGTHVEYADPVARGAAGCVADLSVWLTETPDWWKEAQGGLLLEDENILVKVHDEAVRIRTEYLDRAEQAAKDAKAKLAE